MNGLSSVTDGLTLINKSPHVADSFSPRMPAEWERHEATWLTWPTNRTTWPGKLLKQVEGIYLQMIAALLPGEKVHLLVRDRKTIKELASRLSSKKYPLSKLIFHEVKTVDTWIRDYGPIFVRMGDGRRET